jgi:HEAT repeat protein
VLTTPVLAWIFGIQVVVLAILLLWFWIHGIVSRRFEQRAARLVREVRAVFLDALVTGAELAPVVTLVRDMPRRVQIQLFTSLWPTLSGSQRGYLGELARQSKLVDHAITLCSHPRWWKRLSGSRLLTALGSDAPIMFRLISDAHPLVRAQAAEWAGDDPDGRAIPQLIDMLSDPIGVVRYTAQESLLRIGNESVEPLVEALESGRADPAAALPVAAGIASPGLLQATLVMARHERGEVRALAAQTLGAIGAEAGLEPLTDLLGDPEPETRAEAARALGLLGHWPVGKQVSEMLADPDYAVRREAALALKFMGPPGELLLRRIAEGGDERASAMAKHALDTPGSVAAGRAL